MKYAIDASVALKWVLPEIDSDKALRLRSAFTSAVHELISPDIFSIEVANSLARAERNGAILPGVADIHLANINVSLKRQAALRGCRELPVNKPPSNGKHSNDS